MARDCACITHGDYPHWLHMDAMDRAAARQELRRGNVPGFLQLDLERLQRKRFHLEALARADIHEIPFEMSALAEAEAAARLNEEWEAQRPQREREAKLRRFAALQADLAAAHMERANGARRCDMVAHINDINAELGHLRSELFGKADKEEHR